MGLAGSDAPLQGFEAGDSGTFMPGEGVAHQVSDEWGGLEADATAATQMSDSVPAAGLQTGEVSRVEYASNVGDFSWGDDGMF